MSLAIKYRPTTFEDVVGQDAIIQILQNQIKTKTVKQGYLFVGGSGCGKTTVARIFANTLNNHNGGIIEIDGASNNGVENIRNIIEECKNRPLNTQYKIYIIDECHMITTQGFNALLKVLEEPPKHVIFIFCTTEPHKVMKTILTRVQRFNFKRIPKDEIIKRLQYVATKENITVNDVAANDIAELADGGMREALTILNTCMDYVEPVNGMHIISPQDINNIIGTIPESKFNYLLKVILEKDKKKMCDFIDELHMDGIDLKIFIKQFIEYIINIIKNYISTNKEYSNAYYSLLLVLMKQQDTLKYAKHVNIHLQGVLLLWMQ